MIGWIKVLGLIIFFSTVLTLLMSYHKKIHFLNIQTTPANKGQHSQESLIKPQVNLYQNAKVETSSDSIDTATYTKNVFYNHFTKKASNFVLIDCKFYYCRQDSITSFGSNGGAVYLSSLSISLDRCSFQNNYASLNGGAVYIRSTSSLQIKDSIFHRNTANHFCGAIFLHNIFKGSIIDSNFSNNAANEVSTLSIIYCKNFLTQKIIFYHNYANYNGTVFIEKSNYNDNESMFIRNQGGIASSIRLGGLTNNTFTSTMFLDQEDDPAFVSTDKDQSVFTKCTFTREFKQAFISNNGNYSEKDSIFEQPTLPSPFIQYPPLPTKGVLNKTQAPEEITDTQNRNSELSSNTPQWKAIMFFSYLITLSALGYAVYNHVTWKPRPAIGRHSSNMSNLSNLSRDYSSDRFRLDPLSKRKDGSTNFGESDSKFEEIDLKNLL